MVNCFIKNENVLHITISRCLTLQNILQDCTREAHKAATGNLREKKKLKLNIVKMNSSDGWLTHVRENKTVYVGYACSTTLLIRQKGCLFQL